MILGQMVPLQKRKDFSAFCLASEPPRRRHLASRRALPLRLRPAQPLDPPPRATDRPLALHNAPSWQASCVPRGRAPGRHLRRPEPQLPYPNPHSFRETLAAFGRDVCTSLAEMQAWAQNLGHESLTTTFGSYGKVAPAEQGALSFATPAEKAA
jgi:hypothetical protein